jgi:hypothetical protein
LGSSQKEKDGFDIARIESHVVEFIRQSFANQQLVDFGASVAKALSA